MPHDTQERQQVYQLLNDHIAPDRYTVMAGDMNAAYIPADRSNGVLTPSDQAHQKLLQELHLEPSDMAHQLIAGHTHFTQNHVTARTAG